LRFNLVYMRNNLDSFGKIVIENGNIIERIHLRPSNNHDDFIFMVRNMYDNNYQNEKIDTDALVRSYLSS
jgi:hypothetical protein